MSLPSPPYPCNKITACFISNPSSGLMIYGKKDELVPLEYITELDKRLSAQKGIKVEFQSIPEANHFFSKTEETLVTNLDKYIKKETALY